MKTAEALTRFLKKAEERGLSPNTRRNYYGYLRHFAEEHPDLPTDTRIIEQFLKKRKETPAHRGYYFRMLQAFYSYLEEYEGITSPVPAKGKVGRPRKADAITSFVVDPAQSTLNPSTLIKNKLVMGGHSVSNFTSISTAEAVEALIKSRKIEGVSKRHLEGYVSYFKPFIRKFPILPTTVEPIEEFLGSIKGEPETRWGYLRTLKTLYHFLERRKRIPKDLFEFPKTRVPRKVRRVLADEELRQLFPFTKSFQERVILNLLIDSKVRASELISLPREKVFPDHVVVEGKTGERSVPINPETYGMLIQLATKGLLFRVNGRPMQREYLRLMLRRLMEKSGLEGRKLGPHILRHSASVQHMMHGGDLLSLKEELGHTTTRMTEKYGELAFPQVKQRHQEIDVLGKIVNHQQEEANMERAICYGCGQEIVITWLEVKKTKCPGCGQVGRWYTPNNRSQEEGKHD